MTAKELIAVLQSWPEDAEVRIKSPHNLFDTFEVSHTEFELVEGEEVEYTADWVCPDCGAPVRGEDSIHCWECGADFEEPEWDPYVEDFIPLAKEGIVLVGKVGEYEH